MGWCPHCSPKHLALIPRIIKFYLERGLFFRTFSMIWILTGPMFLFRHMYLHRSKNGNCCKDQASNKCPTYFQTVLRPFQRFHLFSPRPSSPPPSWQHQQPPSLPCISWLSPPGQTERESVSESVLSFLIIFSSASYINIKKKTRNEIQLQIV